MKSNLVDFGDVILQILRDSDKSFLSREQIIEALGKYPFIAEMDKFEDVMFDLKREGFIICSEPRQTNISLKGNGKEVAKIGIEKYYEKVRIENEKLTKEKENVSKKLELDLLLAHWKVKYFWLNYILSISAILISLFSLIFGK